MYQKYQTDALVLAGSEQGEADKIYTLFTKDFGLVRAKAAAVRREASRMRYALQNYSFANVSLVRGKRAWRLAGARAIDGFSVAENLKGAQAFGRITDLLTKLVAGEEKNEYLFDTLIEARKALIASTLNPPAGGEPVIPTIEIIGVARILYTLGYLSAEAYGTTSESMNAPSGLFTDAGFSVESLREAETQREKLLVSINYALAETQLVRR